MLCTALALAGFAIRYTVFFDLDEWIWGLNRAEWARLVEARGESIGSVAQLDAHFELQGEVSYGAAPLAPEQVDELTERLTLAGQLDLKEDTAAEFRCRYFLEHPEQLLVHARTAAERNGALVRAILTVNFWRVRTLEKKFAEECRDQLMLIERADTPEQRELLDEVWERYGASALVSLERLQTRLNPARWASMHMQLAQTLGNAPPANPTRAGVEAVIGRDSGFDELRHHCDLRVDAGPVVRLAMRCDSGSLAELYVDLGEGVVLSGEPHAAARAAYLEGQLGRLADQLMRRVTDGELPEPPEAAVLFNPVADETGCELGYETVDGFFDAVELALDCGDMRLTRTLRALDD